MQTENLTILKMCGHKSRIFAPAPTAPANQAENFEIRRLRRWPIKLRILATFQNRLRPIKPIGQLTAKLLYTYEELRKRMSQTQGFSLCSLSDVPIRRAYNSGNVAVCVFKRRRIAFTRIQNFEDCFSERRGILSGVKKCCRPEKLMFLVRNDNLLLKNALLFGGFSTKCLLFLLCDISSRRRGFLGLQKMDFQKF